jgi:hypothetical protein
MAAPNIFTATNCIAKSAHQLATTSLTAIVTNAAASGKLFKVNSILAVNKSTEFADVTVDIFRSSTSFPLAFGITVPTKSTLIVLGKDTPLYMEEGDVLRISSSTASALNITVVYEEVN